MSRNKGLKYFTLCVINLYNIWVSLSEMSDKNIDLFHDIFFFLDVPASHYLVKILTSTPVALGTFMRDAAVSE